MATEKEIELAKQILAKLTEMDTKLAKIEDSLYKSDGKMDNINGRETLTSVEGKLDDLKSVNKGIQTPFEQGFADVHKGLNEIREIKQIQKKGKPVH
ncbi:chromosome segregation protein SMC [Bacillus cereus group sp. MYBK14-1]|uniref:chromosome segregation protein SMC n=1 Tax=Bacillus cereus group sp. MYBK14-1 TaxID=3450682 RepID=UPI003F790877